VLAVNAIVTGISQPSVTSGNSGAVDVDLAVSPAAAGAVACSAANGIAGVTVLPAGGRGAAAAGPTVAPTGTAPPITSPPATPRPGGGRSVSPSKRAH
jgi:hypothetical protein